MIATTQIARGIYRVAFWDEPDLVSAGLLFPGTTINLFVIDADQPVLIQTGLRRTFGRVRDRVQAIVDPAKLRYLVIPHHEGDSSGAINLWLEVAPRAVPLCSDLCASLSLRDFSDKEPRVVGEGEIVELGSHRLRFFMTPQVNQWDSLADSTGRCESMVSTSVERRPLWKQRGGRGFLHSSEQSSGDDGRKASRKVRSAVPWAGRNARSSGW